MTANASDPVDAADYTANTGIPSTGDKIEMYWPLDNTSYPGLTAEEQNSSQTVVYDDGSIETLDLQNETWRYASSAKLLSIAASSIRLESNVPQVLNKMLAYFGSK